MRTKGFTLIEVIVVITLFMITAFFAVPALKNIILQMQAKTAQTNLMTAIQFAESAAVSYHAPIALCKSATKLSCGGDWRDGQLVFIDTNHDGVVSQPSAILNVFASAEGELHWRGFPQYRNDLQFSAEGLLTCDNGTFWYCRDPTHPPLWALLVSKSGRMRVVMPDKRGEIQDSEGQPLSCG